MNANWFLKGWIRYLICPSMSQRKILIITIHKSIKCNPCFKKQENKITNLIYLSEKIAPTFTKEEKIAKISLVYRFVVIEYAPCPFLRDWFILFSTLMKESQRVIL